MTRDYFHISKLFVLIAHVSWDPWVWLIDNLFFLEFSCYLMFSEESKNAVRIFNEQITALQSSLDDAEHTLNTKLNSPIPRDVDSLEHLVIQHKDFEARLKVR